MKIHDDIYNPRHGSHTGSTGTRKRRATTPARSQVLQPDHDLLEPIPSHSYFACCRQDNGWLLGARLWLYSFLVLASGVQAAVQAVGPIGLTVGNLDQAVDFYTRVLSFEQIESANAEPDQLGPITGDDRTRAETVTLALGAEAITLTAWEGNRGRPVPLDSRSHDLWFQHIAIVVRDMDAAYAHLRKHKVRHVSTAPQTLPDWNPAAGGIRAFYFRDPEDHVLEIIWFPTGKGDPRWQEPTDRLFLGIDHTAIVVSDTARSLAFYRDLLGLKVAGESENYGTEQEHLNQVFGARLRITALRAPRGPGIEFLEYITPPGGRALPVDARVEDLVFWRTHLTVSSPADLVPGVKSAGGTVISCEQTASQETAARLLARDPDGHALECISHLQ